MVSWMKTNLSDAMIFKVMSLLAVAAAMVSASLIDLPPPPAGYSAAGLPPGPPQLAPMYMVDNRGNTHNAAPDGGTLNKPIMSPEMLMQFLDDQAESRARRGVPQ
ncbi:hypothetical protein S40293_11530 [Stachybotrys chartarum IBT 40293]|nr:hypothetical protein S40293_11530 [Stachybotrys chartarum IBT 40293]